MEVVKPGEIHPKFYAICPDCKCEFIFDRSDRSELKFGRIYKSEFWSTSQLNCPCCKVQMETPCIQIEEDGSHIQKIKEYLENSEQLAVLQEKYACLDFRLFQEGNKYQNIKFETEELKESLKSTRVNLVVSIIVGFVLGICCLCIAFNNG